MGRRTKKAWWKSMPPFNLTLRMNETLVVCFVAAVVTTVVVLNALPEAQLGDALLPVFAWMPLSVHPIWWLANLFIWPDWPYFWNLLLFNQMVVSGAVLAAVADGVWGTARTRLALEGRTFQVEGLLWMLLGGEVAFGFGRWMIDVLYRERGVPARYRRK